MPNDEPHASAAHDSEPNLDSFVLRFIRSNDGPSALLPNAHTLHAGGQGISWHGVIRHVQSNRERVFSRWADAVAFIGEFVNVEEHDMQKRDEHEHGVPEDGND